METTNLASFSIQCVAVGLCMHSHLLLEESSLMITRQGTNL